MVRTASTMLELGSKAPPFTLRDGELNLVSIDDFGDSRALLVAFICNHCPYVIHVREELARLGRELPGRGCAMVAINSNDVDNYPADSPAKMVEEAASAGYEFPYLFDEDQSVARAYQAACTPDFFLFDDERRLFYRGQLDGSRPGNGIEVTGSDLRDAIDRLLSDQSAPTDQIPSLGCNIKWKPGNEPAWFPARDQTS